MADGPLVADGSARETTDGSARETADGSACKMADKVCLRDGR